MHILKLFFISFICLLPIQLGAQITNDQVEFKILGRDTIYVEDAITGKLESEIVLEKGGIINFKGEKVYKMTEVNKPAYLHNTHSSIHEILEKYFKNSWSTYPKKKYEIIIKDLLISSYGQVEHYNCFISKQEPFHYKDHGGGNWNRKLISKTKTEIKEILLANKWKAARDKAKAVHAYFDNPIKIVIEIK